ncbi:hypothetical protein GOBAR_DD30398 [Gossypium barbadense]|nr:hypothetical protein GOBAR_DD30398 [Gossypium barbadense]
MATQHDKNYPTVRVTKTVFVLPKSLNPTQTIHLSNLDRECPLLMYVVFFYKSSAAYLNLPLDSIFSCLKSWLEETLSIWYPAAGRLSLNPSDGKLNLWCSNDGAVLVEAVTSGKIIELGDLSQYNEFFEHLAYKPNFHGNFSEMPLVVAHALPEKNQLCGKPASQCGGSLRQCRFYPFADGDYEWTWEFP